MSYEALDDAFDRVLAAAQEVAAQRGGKKKFARKLAFDSFKVGVVGREMEACHATTSPPNNSNVTVCAFDGFNNASRACCSRWRGSRCDARATRGARHSAPGHRRR